MHSHLENHLQSISLLSGANNPDSRSLDLCHVPDKSISDLRFDEIDAPLDDANVDRI